MAKELTVQEGTDRACIVWSDDIWVEVTIEDGHLVVVAPSHRVEPHDGQVMGHITKQGKIFCQILRTHRPKG